MNDLVYVMYNLKLKIKQIKKIVVFLFDDEWIIEESNVRVSVIENRPWQCHSKMRWWIYRLPPPHNGGEADFI